MPVVNMLLFDRWLRSARGFEASTENLETAIAFSLSLLMIVFCLIYEGLDCNDAAAIVRFLLGTQAKT